MEAIMTRRLPFIAMFVSGFAFSVFARRSGSLGTTEFYILLIALALASVLILYGMRRSHMGEDDL
jgi:lipoprotein signal peptidase